VDGGIIEMFVFQLRLLQLGYETATPVQILESCLRYLALRSGSGLLPGEGTRILLLVRDVISYTKLSRYIPHNVTTAVFDLVNRVLMCPNSLIDQEVCCHFSFIFTAPNEINWKSIFNSIYFVCETCTLGNTEYKRNTKILIHQNFY
jgi:hypothetical protein